MHDIILNGINEKLKASVADSSTIWIVHSAMYKAHEKSKCKKGTLARLNEISKFYELAVLQLDGCLKFIQQEADSYNLDGNHEHVLADLTEIRNRLQRRLDEAEMAISQKDQELNDRMENELKLQKEMEVTEQELRRMRAKLKLERTKSEEMEMIICNRVNADKGRDGEFGELKNSVDQQVRHIKQKLDHDHDNEERRGIEDKKIQQMSVEINNLKETMDLAFGKMENAILSLEMGPLGQQWMCNIEKDVISILITGFIRDFRGNLEEEIEKQKRPRFDGLSENWFDLMREVTSLRDKLEFRSSLNETSSETKGELKITKNERSKSLPLHSFGSSKIPPKDRTLDSVIGCSEEDGDHFLVKMMKNHKSIIRQRSEELSSWLKCDILRENEDPVTPKGRIRDVVLILDNIINLNDEMGKTSAKNRGIVIEESDRKNEKDTGANVCEEVENVLLCGSKSEELNNEIRKLRLEKEELNMEIMIVEDIYHLLIEGLENQFYCELLDRKCEKQVSDDICKFYINEILKEWDKETNHMEIEADMRETIHNNVFVETLKDITYAHNLVVREYQHCMEKLKSREPNSSMDRMCNQGGTQRENGTVLVTGENTTKWCNRDDIESLVREEIHKIVFSESLRSITDDANELNKYQGLETARGFEDDVSLSSELNQILERLLQEDVYDVFFMEMVKKWRMETDTNAIEDLSRDKLYQLVIAEVENGYNFFKETNIWNKSNVLQDVTCRSEELDKKMNSGERLIKEADTLGSSGSKLEKTLQQEVTLEAPSCQLGPTSGIVNGDMKLTHDQEIPVSGNLCDRVPSTCPQRAKSEVLDSVLTPLVGFKEAITDLESTANDKLGMLILRLGQVEHKLNHLAQQVTSLKERKCLYKNAFIRKCQNLQKAEIEVDMLGDQVEMLLSLLENIHKHLHQHSAILGHYFEVSNILKLIKKELEKF